MTHTSLNPRPVDDYYPAPRVWTGNGPMPDVRTVSGLLKKHYETTLIEARIDRHDGPDCNWTLAAWDTRTDWFGGVVSAFGTPVWAFIGNENGVQRVWSNTCSEWPWDMFDSVKRLLTLEVFRAAHREGTDAPYWIAAETEGVTAR